MTTIAILPEQSEDHLTTFSAVTTGRKATGRTAGEALDALTSQLSAEETGAPVVVQQFLPDQLFSAVQRDRLSALMARWRAARETGNALPPAEQSELERLVDEEVEGSAERAAHILRDLDTTRRGLAWDEMTWADLRARCEQESRLASRLDTAAFIAGVLITFLLPVACVLILTGSIFPVISMLVSCAVGSAFGLLLDRRAAAAHERVARLYTQAEGKYRFYELLIPSLESSAKRSKGSEQTKAQ